MEIEMEEPNLVVPAHLRSVLEELKALEPHFHTASVGTTPDQLNEMMAPEFWEVGASGRRYSRTAVLSVLQQRRHDPTEESWITKDYQILEIAAGNYLLTYTLEQAGRVTRRATLWRRSSSGWKAVYHQGTLVEHTIC